ncbi:MAG TPA: hypothetical protein V6C64_05700 [Microcoleaceae cyanobacterium]
MKTPILMAAIVLLIAATGCGNGASNTAARQAELCQDLASLKTAVATLRSMGPNNTVKELKQARKDVDDRYEEVKKSAQAVQEAQIDDLRKARKQLETAVKKIPDKATLAQAQASIKDEVAAVDAALAQLNTSVKCNP